MGSLAGFVADHSAKLVETWIQRVRAHLAPDDTTGPELRDHIPLLLQELVQALGVGVAPTTTTAAMAHGRQREELGFDVDALVREYGMLRQVILDGASAAQVEVTVPDLRLMTDFLTMAMAEGVAAYARHQRRAEAAAAEQREKLLSQERAARAEAETERLKLRAADERQRRMLEASGASLWDLDLTTNRLQTDERLRSFVDVQEGTPFSLDAMLGLVDPRDRQRAIAAIEAAMAGADGGRYLLEFRTAGTGGAALRWIESRAQVSFDSDGKPLRIAGSIVDITPRKLAEEAREEARLVEQQARREAETANRAKDEFLAMLGHELRNPLAPMTTALEVMSLDPDGAYPRERAILRRQVDHLRRLVDDLLDVSRITRGAVEITRQPVAFHEVVANAIEMTTPLFEKKQLHLTVDVASEDLFVEGDPIRLAQVVANLLNNAGKYTQEGGNVAVTVTATNDPSDSIVLSVHDNGIGIAPDMLPRVFELFTQERQAIDRAVGGLGLGLAIVRQIVELHGGNVTAKSEGLHRGAEFTVQLPRLAAPSRASRQTLARATQGGAPSHRQRRILIIDDNREAAQLLASSLAAHGHDVRVAHDGPEALTEAERFRPELAVLDIGLPVMDGYELAARLRTLAGLERLRLVALTGYDAAVDRQRIKAVGFDAHLAKPVQLGAIELIINAMVD